MDTSNAKGGIIEVENVKGTRTLCGIIKNYCVYSFHWCVFAEASISCWLYPKAICCSGKTNTIHVYLYTSSLFVL